MTVVLIAPPKDSLTIALQGMLEQLGCDVVTTADPFGAPLWTTWRMHPGGSVTTESRCVAGGTPGSVFVRSLPSPTVMFDQADDKGYATTELASAVLAWLHALPCPVVNRYSASTWFQGAADALHWCLPLGATGLPAVHSIISNVGTRFGGALAAGDVPGWVFEPLAGGPAYPLNDEVVWQELWKIQERMPTHLRRQGDFQSMACVVGDVTVWNGGKVCHQRSLDLKLQSLRCKLQLDFFVVHLTECDGQWRTLALEPFPAWVDFDAPAQDRIVETLARLLAVDADVAGVTA